MSTDACYTARASTRTQVLDAIKRLNLPKTSSGQYNHDDSVKHFTAITRVLKETYNPGDPGHGMEKLMREHTPLLPATHPTNATSTYTATADSVLQHYRDLVANITPVQAPLVTDRTEAQDQADRLNLQNQAVIGAKEGATTAIVEQFGRDVTDSVLRTADGIDYKGIDEYHLYDLVQAAIQGADRPATGDILGQLIEVISTKFDFRKKVINNVEALRAKCARLTSYGVALDDTQLALIILANVELASTQEFGSEFKTTLRSIRRQYAYSHVHDQTSIATILQELAAADSVRQLKDAPAPTAGIANAVYEQYSSLARLLQGQAYDSTSDEEGSAAAASDDGSKASRSTYSRGRKKEKKDKKKDKKRDKKKEKGNRSRSRVKIKHNCPHCKKQKRGTPHPEHIPFDKCNWNPKYKGYRAGWVCRIMEIDFKPRKDFAPELGGYAKSVQADGSSSDDSSSSSGSETS